MFALDGDLVDELAEAGPDEGEGEDDAERDGRGEECGCVREFHGSCSLGARSARVC